MFLIKVTSKFERTCMKWLVVVCVALGVANVALNALSLVNPRQLAVAVCRVVEVGPPLLEG